MRERRPGVWEIRIAAGTDSATGRTLQRSVTFRGTEADAAAYRRTLAAQHVAQRSIVGPSPRLTVAELLERWLEADQPWKPSTRIGYQSNARFLRTAEPLARLRVLNLTPGLVRGVLSRWEAQGASRAVISGRFRVLG